LKTPFVLALALAGLGSPGRRGPPGRRVAWLHARPGRPGGRAANGPSATPRLAVFLACSLFAADAWAIDIPDVDAPDIVEHAATPAGFVPPGWRLEHETRGRLDGDGLDDALLVLRMDAPANIVDNTGLGPARFDTNPRALVAALATPDGRWRRVMANHSLLPRPASPVMDDVLAGDAASAVLIRPNRTWSVNLHSWASAGTWSTREVTYTFRLEGDCMRLVGLDEMHLHRGAGEITTTSVNYLTGRAWTRAGHVSEDAAGPEHWTRLPSAARICIADIGDGLSFDARLSFVPAP